MMIKFFRLNIKVIFMRLLLFFISLICMATQTNAQSEIFNNLLKKHVSDAGFVDYKSFKDDKLKLDNYISYLEKTSPNNSWSDNKQKAFWINTYNAYTIKLIIENYPLKSILDIHKKNKNAWNIPFVKVGGKTYTLDVIEHQILRKKFSDPRIHVGVNCASISCPKLTNAIFTEKNIERKLDELMKLFINDTSKNKLNPKSIKVSAIFKWFQDDFTKENSLIFYLNKYTNTPIQLDAKINYLEYNWSLNVK